MEANVLPLENKTTLDTMNICCDSSAGYMDGTDLETNKKKGHEGTSGYRAP
jgi:hypothetical protein